ncbi:MAG: S8 family peptidase [Chitinophagales bacterium]|nr:S8 family peptidase [Chitinophagales bacterium]
MEKKSHLKFISERQLSEIKVFEYKYGFGSNNDDEDTIPKNYYPFANSLKEDLQKFDTDVQIKYRQKDRKLNVPSDIDYVLFTFQDQFVINKYFDHYYNEFGLEATAFYDFAKKGLFAVIDREKFQTFITNVNSFIEYHLEHNHDVRYSEYVKYIASFKLLRTDDILKFNLENAGTIVYLSLVDLPLYEAIKQQIVQSLEDYLNANNILFKHDVENDRIELQKPTQEQIQKIVQNFDIIESATSSAFTTVRPSGFNIVERQFGFDIQNPDEDLPVVGIIDTGVAQQTALAPLIINDISFTLAGNPLIDIAGRNRLGHGTAVAGLVALGRMNHKNNFENEVRADAKLLSIKISDSGSGYISEIDLLKMLYAVKAKYPEIRLFTLTTCYNSFMYKNEAFSDYTHSLDKFAYETNSLIFICTGNNENCINENTVYDLSYFQSDHTNLSTPADSMNNVTIGAAADNLKDGAFLGIASGREFPTLYTRKGHIDLSAIYDGNKSNKNYFKPDVIESGGDMGYYNANTLDWTDEPALTLLSARPEIGMMQEVGTSFAAPLVANLAAKIIKNYPGLSNESVKALIINGASQNLIPFDRDVSKLRDRVIGNGLVDEFKSLYSNENSATLILEDIIEDDMIRIYPIHFPEYLVNDDLGKKRGILKVTATLCFKFLPIKNNQLSYNPIHMAFSIFKNHSADDIMKSEKELKSKLKTTLSWSENGRHVSKPLPYSNTQKIFLNVNVDDLNNENNTFKLAIHSKLSEQIVGGLPDGYPTEFPFSIVLTIEETIKNNSGKLYDEIQLVNEVEAIQDINLDAGLEAEALDV